MLQIAGLQEHESLFRHRNRPSLAFRLDWGTALICYRATTIRGRPSPHKPDCRERTARHRIRSLSWLFSGRHIRSPVSSRALGECNAIRSQRFSQSRLTFVSTIDPFGASHTRAARWIRGGSLPIDRLTCWLDIVQVIATRVRVIAIRDPTLRVRALLADYRLFSPR